MKRRWMIIAVIASGFLVLAPWIVVVFVGAENSKAKFDLLKEGMTQAEVENAIGRNADDVLDTRDDRHCYWYLDDGEIAITLENNRLVHKRWEPSTLTWLERLMNKLAWN